MLDACCRRAYLKVMTIRPIIEVPDKRLKTISQPVAEVTDDTRDLMDDMLDTMYDANGIGLLSWRGSSGTLVEIACVLWS